MRFVRSVPGRSAAERARLGGPELAPEEDVPDSGARLDDRRQAAGEDRRRKSVQTVHATADQLLSGNHTDVAEQCQRGHHAGERDKNCG